MKKLLLSFVLTLFVSAPSFADIEDMFKYFIPEDETLIEEKQTYSDFPRMIILEFLELKELLY